DRILPYFEEGDDPVDAPSAGDLMTGEPGPTAPEPAPLPEERPGDYDPIGEEHYRPVTPRELPPSSRHDPIAGPEAEQSDTGEPEHRPETTSLISQPEAEQDGISEQDDIGEPELQPEAPDTVTEPDSEQEAAGEQQQPSEGNAGPDIPLDTDGEPAP